MIGGSPDNAGLNAQEAMDSTALQGAAVRKNRFVRDVVPLAQWGVDLTVLMEQFLDGPEVDVDAPRICSREVEGRKRKHVGSWPRS